MILLKTLQLKDFLSHKATIINFNPEEKLLIDGKSGSGKSSIVEAIVWAFYGKGRADNRALIRRGAKSATVSVQIENDGVTYEVVREINKQGKQTLVLYECGKDKLVPLPVTGLKQCQDFL